MIMFVTTICLLFKMLGHFHPFFMISVFIFTPLVYDSN